MKSLGILPPVLADIADAAAWYDEHGYEGLGDRFIGTFYAALPHLQEQSEIHRIVYREFRRILHPPFPYFVYFASHPDSIIVTLAIHTSRHPSLAEARLRQRAPGGAID